jgi:hypothetical protein
MREDFKDGSIRITPSKMKFVEDLCADLQSKVGSLMVQKAAILQKMLLQLQLLDDQVSEEKTSNPPTARRNIS